MAIPLILFPTALTGSVSVLLLPYVAQSQEQQDAQRLGIAIKKSLTFALLLGFSCTVFFFILGRFLGDFLFHSPLAGTFIMSMSFLCPFLYSGNILSSILHGLGKAGSVFLYAYCLADYSAQNAARISSSVPEASTPCVISFGPPPLPPNAAHSALVAGRTSSV